MHIRAHKKKKSGFKLEIVTNTSQENATVTLTLQKLHNAVKKRKNKSKNY